MRLYRIAGHRDPGFVDGSGSNTRFAHPSGIAIDVKGGVLVADRSNHVIRKCTRAGRVWTVVGSSVAGFKDGPFQSAQFQFPNDLAIEKTGALVVADTGNSRIRRVSHDGQVTTVATPETAAFFTAGDHKVL